MVRWVVPLISCAILVGAATIQQPGSSHHVGGIHPEPFAPSADP